MIDLQGAEDSASIKERKILEIMLEHCVGRQNAKKWAELSTLFAQNGINVVQQSFQQLHLAVVKASII